MLSSHLNHFYTTLANGADDEIASLIYRRDLLSPGELQCCVNGVTHHCRAQSEDGRILERHRQFSSSEEFALLIVVPSWMEDVEDNYVPLIVDISTEQISIAGIVLPFDGLMTNLRGPVCAQIGELSAAWIIRKINARKMATA